MTELHHAGSPILETERLILRPYREADADAMYRNWTSSDRVTEYLTWPTHTSRDTSLGFIRWLMDKAEDPKTYHWGIELKETGEVIGDIAVVDLQEEIAAAELGWCLGEAWWGRGIMPEAGRAVLDHLFGTVGMNRVFAGHDVRNPKSGRVMDKLGMKPEGVLRRGGRNNQGICDVMLHSILREEWEQMVGG